MTQLLSKKSIEAYLLDPLFENSDFTDGAVSRKWWEKEFKQASRMNPDELKQWADDMLIFTYDFAKEKYYLKEEVELLLNSIIKMR